MIRLLALFLCCHSLSVAAMQGGDLVKAGFEAVGSLKGKDQKLAACTATLIAPDWIMTADHCRYGGGDEDAFIYEPAQMEFLLGNDSRKPTQKIALKKWVHAGDGDDYLIDVLFAQLERPLVGVTPIPLRALKAFQGREAATYQILGFGVSDQARRVGKKQVGSMALVATQGNAFEKIFKTQDAFAKFLKAAMPGEEEFLEQHWGKAEVVKGYEAFVWDPRGRASGVFTAAPAGGWVSSCNGDSGGPLLQTLNNQTRIVGVISSGFNGAVEGCVRLGTKVSIIGPKTLVELRANRVPFE